MLATTFIRGAALAAKRDPETGRVCVQYQPRIDRGLLWDVTYRDSYGTSSGWVMEVFWGESKEDAFYRAPQHGLPYREDHVAPWFDHQPVGWSPEQIAEAERWAASVTLERAS